jgi:ribose transport system substrate-binding protein
MRRIYSRRGARFGLPASLAIGALAAVLAGCGSGSPGSSGSSGSSGGSASASSKPITIPGGTGPLVKPANKQSLSSLNVAFFYDPTNNAYVEAYKRTAASVASQLGIKLTEFGSNDESTQINQIQTAEGSGRYNAWIVAAFDPVQECDQILSVAKRVPVLILNQGLCGHNTYTPGTVSFVGSQTTQVFSKFFGYIADHNAQGGQVALLTGPALNYNTDNCEAEFKAMLKAHPNFTVAANEQIDYTEATAFTATTDLLHSHPNLKILVTDYADMTVGAARAVSQLGLTGKVKVYDLGASNQVLQDVKSGDITMSDPLLPVNEVTMAIQAMARYWQGDPVSQYYNPASELNFPGAPFITKANVSDFTPAY